MKWSTSARGFGIFEASFAGYVGYHGVDSISKIDYSTLGSFMLSEYPLEYKAAIIGVTAGLALLTAATTVLIADGVTDAYKGTHHYLGLKIWHKITKKPEKKKQIESELESMLTFIEKEKTN